ncbi:TPA: hypothetical protein QDE31_37580 [Burkholderia cenocepacia]|nr:hypothetical protein [Burkholderia cenocepacia]HDR9875418.1 hypothetical protein [Burkholderia cenocepacia]
MHVIAATLALAGCKPYEHDFSPRSLRVMAVLEAGKPVLRMPENDVSKQSTRHSYRPMDWEDVPASMLNRIDARVLREFMEML